MRVLPGKSVHKTIPQSPYVTHDDYDLLKAAYDDFCEILLNSSHDVVMEMLSEFAAQHIVGYAYNNAIKEKDASKRVELIDGAFEKFDRFTNCMNQVFEQFGVNQVVTRNGFVPRQDQAILDNLYHPTMMLLADPIWSDVSQDLGKMFSEFRNRRYSETITKAHSATQRFFQILAGEGKNGRGELKKLVGTLRAQGTLPSRDNFIEPVASALLSFLPSERASNSTAKPISQETKPAEALLVINVVLVLIQFCLQH